jgi:hypothetical protein
MVGCMQVGGDSFQTFRYCGKLSLSIVNGSFQLKQVDR